MVADLPAMIELFVVAVRGGMLPVQAIRHLHDFVPPSLAPAVAEVVGRLDSGSRFADALDSLVVHVGPAGQPFVEALRLAELHGLPMAPVLDRLAAEARQQRRADAEATARQLPVRLSLPLVTCSLSSFVVLAIVPLLLGALSSLHEATPFPIPHTKELR
jgi:tight adherence protein C